MTKELEPSFITVRRTARYYTIGQPDELVRDLWLVCHGYRQLAADFAVPFESLTDASRLILVPEALNRFYIDSEPERTRNSAIGATWMTRSDRDHEIRDVVGYLDILYEWALGQLAQHGVARDRIRVHALGFSQGAVAAARWAARGEAIVDHLVVWGHDIPEDVNLRALAERRPGLEIDLVYGERDRWITTEKVDAQRAILAASGASYRVRGFDGGHTLNRAILRELMEPAAG